MQTLFFLLMQMCRRNRDGSYGTQAARESILKLMATQLEAIGFKHMTPDSLKPKHVTALVGQWHEEGLSVGTMKNRMAELRWWAEKVGKQNVIAATNDHYGIARRVFVTNASKARTLRADELERVNDPYTRLSLMLQAEFGLRKEESIKVRPVWADRGDHLVLKDSWTKGGKTREVPIVTPAQRAVVDEAKAFVGGSKTRSLIPVDMTYVQQMKRFEYQCGRAGIDNVHGHRHSYAQRRYFELTGMLCPAAGGPCSKDLTPEQKSLDRQARLVISRELGHEREQVTAIYLGR
jgi:integrase